MGNLMSCVLICGAMEVVQVVNTNGRVERLIRPIRAAELIWAQEKYRAGALAAGLNSIPNPSLSTLPSSSSSSSPPRSSSTEEDKLKLAKCLSAEDSNPKFLLLPLDPSAATTRSSSAEVGCRAYKFQCHSQENVSVAAAAHHEVKSSKQQRSRSKSDAPAPPPPPKPAAEQSTRGAANHPPFRVKKEGGVTTLVVSKRYLEQLLVEKEMKAADAVAAADILQDHNYLPRKVGGGGGAAKHSRRSSRSSSSCGSSSGSSSGRSGIWRPALESISESHNAHGGGGDQIGSGSHSHSHHHHHQQRQSVARN
ncbi:uncharacterized protein LOC112345136 [Selaginella moellendorffii]|uniref:uncharacterized protein LOC112345136 n=1 Tax=Selaginella moellendorffii TaxID=88036 RepID=UPI000D1D1193|nr:uncharacterized protein LOC112345136 [Selaginella moellendorffii]|eukprot:XP_024527056.1 uncharacterized protein LOC112345136 [Selaginella moellendorffii]